MKSVVEVEINAPQATVAELFADPRTFPEWMEDVARIEPLGKASPASPETEYRLVPKKGNLAFVARVIRREPPYRSRLAMRTPNLSVLVTGTFVKLSDHKTKLIAKNVFRFGGVMSRLAGLLGRRAMRRSHRRHMESFKRFAEAHA